MELKQKQVLITTWIIGSPEGLRSVAGQFSITKSILVRVYHIANNLSGQYMKYLIVWNWAPLGKWLISDPSPKGTRLISDSMIRL